MNHGPLLFLGLLLSMALSWTGLVLVPQFQIGDQPMVRIEETMKDYPLARSGQARQGAKVYRANGCQYCHTQLVRGARSGLDLARGWGARRTVPRDYLRETPVLLGSVRYGPDLTNIGARTDHEEQLFLKLYDPRTVVAGSPMPRYPYLFEERALKPGQPPSPDALKFPDDYPLPEGVDEVVPRPGARMLVAYLRSLRAEPLFFEVFPTPTPKSGTNAPPEAAAGTNAPPAGAGTTNPPPAEAASTNAPPAS